MSKYFTDYEVIDLSLEINAETVVYPGDSHPRIIQTMNFKDDGICLHELNISLHTGTHFDFPRHIIKDGKTLKDFPVGSFVFNAVKIDLEPDKNNPPDYRRAVNINDIKLYEEQLSPADAVIFHTGFGKYLIKNDGRKDFPYINPDAAKYLTEFPNLRLIGIDSLSVDPLGLLESHKIILGSGRLLLEKVVNLDKLPLEFKLAAFPLPLGEVDASPCRALGLVDKSG